MPIYEYLCEKCDVRFEEERNIDNRKKLAVCPKCLLAVAKLVPSLGTFVLKGTGWWGGHDPGSSEYP